MISMIYLVIIGEETLKMDSGYSWEKEFTELIFLNRLIMLYLIINQVDSCHCCVCGPLVLCMLTHVIVVH